MILKNEFLIPLEKEWGDNWMDYNKSIYLIRYDEEGNIANFQFDGCACAQGSIKGFVHKQFKSKSKWFNTDWWYKKTAWGIDYSKRLYFKTQKIDGDYPDLSKQAFEEFLKKTDEIADKEGRPSKNILENIIKTAVKKTGINIELDFPPTINTDYGIHWWEAYIPVKFGKKLEHRGILTWMNCD